MEFVFSKVNLKLCVMKERIFTLGIAVTLLLTACSKDKEEISAQASEGGIAARGARSSAVVTGWESGYQWDLADSNNYIIYLHNRSFSELTSELLNGGGAVVVWVRNYKSDEGRIIEKPMQTPFAVLPPFGRPAYNNYWYHQAAPGSVTVKFRSNKPNYTSDPVPAPDANTQFRYFLIPRSDLDAWNQTAASVNTLTYTQLTQLAGVAE